MRTSILSILPSIHSTILSIAVAFSTILLLNAYQEILKNQVKLSDYSRQIANIMKLSVFSLKDNEKYKKGRPADIETQLHRDLIRVISMHQSLDFERFTGRKYEVQNYSEDEIIDAMSDLIDVITTIATTYPYYGNKYPESEADIKSTELDKKWAEDLMRLNIFYIQQYDSRKLSIDGLIKKYNDISAARRKKVIEKGWYHEKQLENGTIQGQYTKEGDELFRDGKVDMLPNYDRTKVIQEFFSKLLFIQNTMIPLVSETVHSLKYNEQKFKIKAHSERIILFAIFLVIFGIIIPMFLITCEKVTPLTEYFLLGFTMLPYIVGLFYLLKIVGNLKTP